MTGHVRELADMVSQRATIEAKPNLERLADDVRREADTLPDGDARRRTLETLLAAFGPALRNDFYADPTEAETDEFRQTWGIKP